MAWGSGRAGKVEVGASQRVFGRLESARRIEECDVYIVGGAELGAGCGRRSWPSEHGGSILGAQRIG